MVLKIFEEPRCLIDTSDEGGLQAVQEYIEELKSLDKPLVIIAIAGLYRTGKSYLMNRLAGKTEGKGAVITPHVCDVMGVHSSV